jgi:hypothetical protein
VFELKNGTSMRRVTGFGAGGKWRVLPLPFSDTNRPRLLGLKSLMQTKSLFWPRKSNSAQKMYFFDVGSVIPYAGRADQKAPTAIRIQPMTVPADQGEP